MGTFVTALFEVNFANLYRGRKLLAKYFIAISPVSRSLLSFYKFKIRLCLTWMMFLKVASKKF